MIGDWRKNLLRASYRGVPFYVDTYGGEHGRRWADHEYPGRDTPYAEDLGRSQRTWKFSGYLIGDDYPLQRNILVTACELPGPGLMVHPTIGAVMAVCRKIEHTEERTRGRYVVLSLEFGEAGQLLEPSTLSVVASVLAAAALPLGAVLAPSFTKSFNTTGGGPWLTTAAQGKIVDLGVTLQQMRLPAPGIDQGKLDRAIATLVEDSAELAADPPALSTAMDTAFAEFTNAGEAQPVVSSMLRFATPTLTLTQLKNLVTSGVINNPGVTPIVDRRRSNTIAFETYARGLALREVGYAITGVPLSNYDEAIALLDTAAQTFIALETVVANEGDDDSYAALANLRAAVTQLILARAASLTPLINYRVPAATPANSLAMAWRLYQDSGRDLEIVDRTAARNPAFLPFTGRVLAP